MAIEVNDSNFKSEVLDSDIPVLVDFWAVWCGPCQMVAPAVEAVAVKYKGRLKVCKVNVDEAPETSSQYGIMSIPTLAVFKNGNVVEQIVGALPEREIDSRLKAHI
jgi:thioredoxin 1